MYYLKMCQLTTISTYYHTVSGDQEFKMRGLACGLSCCSPTVI